MVPGSPIKLPELVNRCNKRITNERVHKDDINDYQSLIDSTLAFATSPAELKGKLSFIVKTVADTLNTGTSLILLDSSHKNLIHHTSFKLPKYYLQKGLIDPRQSLDEIQSGQPVIINNIDSQSHLQYSELALQARITSIAGFPIVFDDNVIGSLRIYQRSGKTFFRLLNFARQSPA
jgi:hypoxanthine phosphoribosyltransferase